MISPSAVEALSRIACSVFLTTTHGVEDMFHNKASPGTKSVLDIETKILLSRPIIRSAYNIIFKQNRSDFNELIPQHKDHNTHTTRRVEKPLKIPTINTLWLALKKLLGIWREQVYFKNLANLPNEPIFFFNPLALREECLEIPTSSVECIKTNHKISYYLQKLAKEIEKPEAVKMNTPTVNTYNPCTNSPSSPPPPQMWWHQSWVTSACQRQHFRDTSSLTERALNYHLGTGFLSLPASWPAARNHLIKQGSLPQWGSGIPMYSVPWIVHYSQHMIQLPHLLRYQSLVSFAKWMYITSFLHIGRMYECLW